MIKVLIVEDDPVLARMYKTVFSMGEYEVETAENGKEGLECVKLNKPDIILLDVMMPKMNGMQMLDQLKADDMTRDIPVIMLTNLNEEKDAEEAVKKGASRYIIKSSVEPQQVLEMVQRILN